MNSDRTAAPTGASRSLQHPSPCIAPTQPPGRIGAASSHRPARRLRPTLLLAAVLAAAGCGDRSNPLLHLETNGTLQIRPSVIRVDDGTIVGASATLRDASGNRIEVIPGDGRLTWTIFGSTVARVADNGLEARVEGLKPGRTTLSASLGSLSASVPVDVLPVAAEVVRTSPPVVLGLSGELAPQAPRVQVVDRHGSPVAGVAVRFEVVSGGGALARDRVTSDAFGYAETPWVLGPELGLQTVEASVDGTPPTQLFSYVNGDLESVNLSAITGGGSAGTVGQALPELLEIRARDAQGRPVMGVGVEWSTTAGTLLPLGPVTDVEGRAQARWILGPNPGLQTASVHLILPEAGDRSAPGVPGGGEVVFEAEAHHATPSRVSVLPEQVVLELGNAAQASVAVFDALGNLVPGPHATSWSVEFEDLATATPDPTGDAVLTGIRTGQTPVIVAAGGLVDTLDLIVRPVGGAGGGGGTAPVTLTLAPDTVTVEEGRAAGLAVTAQDATGQLLPTSEAIWTSADSTIATVDAFGRVLARSAGSTRITVSLGGLSTSATVVVTSTATPPGEAGTPQRVSDLRVVATGESTLDVAFTAGHDGAGAPARHELRWAASPLGWGWGQATIVRQGACASPIIPDFVGQQVVCTITGLSSGRSYDVQMVGWRLEGENRVFSPLSNLATGVTNSPSGDPEDRVEQVVVSPGTAAARPGDTRLFTATALDAAGNPVTGVSVSWTSTNEAIATIDASGRLTAISEGTASVRATVGGHVGSASVSVSSEAPTSTVAEVSVTPSTASLDVGGSTQLSAVARDGSGTVLSGVSFAWGSSDSGVVSVNSNGRITGQGAGSAVVTASAQGFVGSATVTVTDPGGGGTGTPATITVTPSSPTLAQGGTTLLVAQALDASGNPVSSVGFTWSSSAPGVASVDGTGRVTAVAPGSAVIRASSSGVSGTAQVTVVAGTPGGVWAQQTWNFPDRATMLADPSLSAGGNGTGLGDSRPITLPQAGPWGGTKVLENYYGVIPATSQPQVGTHWDLPDGAREIWIETWIRFGPNWEIGPDNPNYPGNVDHKTIFIWEGDGSGPWAQRWEVKFGPNWKSCVASAASHDISYHHLFDPPLIVQTWDTRNQRRQQDPTSECDARRDVWDGQWHNFRLHLKMGAGDGQMEVWWDGVKMVDMGGNLNTQSGNRWFDAITFGGNRNQGTNRPMSFFYGPARVFRTNPGW